MSAPNWYPDPTGRHQLRYWDGAVWTDHVADDGTAGNDPVTPAAAPLVQSTLSPQAVQQQVTGTGWGGAGVTSTAFAGGGTLFTEPVLVVNQKAKVLELTNQYAVFTGDGRQIASVNQVGQNAAKKVLRALTSLDQFMTHRMEIADTAGVVQLRLTRPAKVFKSTIVVEDPSGGEVGRIVQENMVGKIRFDLQSAGQTVGSLRAENWRAWNFQITDHSGAEVARITKTWEGLAKQMFTTADNYVVQIHRPLSGPLAALVVASALSVDTALKQDARGLG
jgi:uncharacterized protein YxjI